MFFTPYIFDRSSGQKISAEILPATKEDQDLTSFPIKWQSDWNSEYLNQADIHRYALKTESGELVAMAAYRIANRKAYVYIVYMESAPDSNPTVVPSQRRKYLGIGAVLIAFGIKFSIDNGCRGDIVFDAKTSELAEHYALDFGAIHIPSPVSGGPQRFMLGDEPAWKLFSRYLSEEEKHENK